MIAKNGKHMEDSVYAQAYQAYTTGDYAQVEKNYLFSTENFPQGIHRARMLFIRAMANLYGGERDTFLVSLKEVVQKYPKEEVTQLANAIVKGLDEGRQLMSEQYDASSIWARRTRKEGADSTDTAKQLSEERYTNFVFILAYPAASLAEPAHLIKKGLRIFRMVAVDTCHPLLDAAASDNFTLSILFLPKSSFFSRLITVL